MMNIDPKVLKQYNYIAVYMANVVIGKTVVNYIVEFYPVETSIYGGVPSRNGAYHEYPRTKHYLGKSETYYVSSEDLPRWQAKFDKNYYWLEIK